MTIGRILGYDESRDIAVIRDTLGKVTELLPVNSSSKIRLRLSLDLPSGRSVDFSVDVPPEVLSLFSETIRVPRSVDELAVQLQNDLNGVEDAHDKVVNAVEKTAKWPHKNGVPTDPPVQFSLNFTEE